MIKAPPVATANPMGLMGVTRWPSTRKLSVPQPMIVPPMPIAIVAIAPPGIAAGHDGLGQQADDRPEADPHQNVVHQLLDRLQHVGVGVQSRTPIANLTTTIIVIGIRPG